MNYQASRRGACVGARAFLIAAVVVAAAAGAAQAQESNLDVMAGLTRAVVTDIVDGLEEARDGRGLRLAGAMVTEEYRFVENVFTSVLDQRGVQVYMGKAQPEADAAALELRFETLEFGLVYPGVFRSYLIGGKNVRRNATVTIVATLVDPSTGAVLDVVEASQEDADTFSYADLGTIERGTFDFLHPPIPASGWSRIVEPVFVSGIIVGLIYLFFSNQSDE